ncbi:MAG: hypothetical protein JXR37_20775 [Kiritimatiellae bacterium]|nr:hypothetical protein [Kiritimatiellia bacterium]
MKSNGTHCIILVVLALAGCRSCSDGAEPVWPGSATRFYPGIYPRANGEPAAIAKVLDEWWAHVDRDTYREVRNGRRLTHVGLKCSFLPNAVFAPYWREHEKGPHDYAGSRTNSVLMQNPDAVVDGHKVYDWSWFDAILAFPLVEQGECKVIFKIDDQGIGRRNFPRWWVTQGMMLKEHGDHPRKYDWVYAWCKMDFLQAFATRYAGNPKIAGFEIEEYAGIRDEGPVCGYVVPDQSWQVSAENGSSLYPAKAMLEADPSLMIFFIGAAACCDQYFEGAGSGLGLDDLPGVQGVCVQDVHFFVHSCGEAAPGTPDCPPGRWAQHWLAQQAMIRDDLAVMVHAERNGWRVRAKNPNNRRGGNLNPWNVAVWPKTDQAWDGEKVGGAGTYMFPDAAFWVWYCSGPPKARGPAADSRLGQPGPDPAGVIPAHFYEPSLPWVDKPGDKKEGRWRNAADSWNKINLNPDRYRKAFELFGPSGTQAMFAFPKGYVEAVMQAR